MAADEQSEMYDDEELTPEELEYYQKRLEEERKNVKSRLAARIRQMDVSAERPADELDQAGRLSNQAFVLKLADKERKLLNQIEHALAKLEKGDYGLCEGTGEQISRKRLELRPWTRYSIEYKEELERNKMHCC